MPETEVTVDTFNVDHNPHPPFSTSVDGPTPNSAQTSIASIG